MKKMFFITSLLLLSVQACFAGEDITLIDESKSDIDINLYKSGTYVPPNGEEIKKAVFEIHYEVSGFDPDYRKYVEVFAGDSGYYSDDDYHATGTSKTVTFDVTNDVKDGKLDYMVHIELRDNDYNTMNANVTAALHITYKSDTQNNNNQTTKAPIPLLAIILTLIIIPLITLRKIKQLN